MFRYKDYVIEVNKERSFSKAAKNLYISQPSLSATIRNIEAKIGLPIFDRSTSPIRLTECGEKYLEAATQIRYQEENFENYVNSVKGILGGGISIGTTNFLMSTLVPPIIMSFLSRHPDVSIHLTEGNLADLEAQLFAGELDFVIEANDFDEQVYSRQRLCHEHLVLAVPKTIHAYKAAMEYELTKDQIVHNVHLTKDIPSVPFDLFTDENFILLKEGNDIRSRADKMMEAGGFAPKILFTLDQQMTAFNMVEQGVGITFLSDTLIKNSPVRNNVAIFRLDNGNAHRNVYLYHKTSRFCTPAMERFLEEVKN